MLMSNMKQGAKEGLGVQDKKTSCETCLVKKEHTTRQAKLGAKTRLFCFRDDPKCDPGQFID